MLAACKVAGATEVGDFRASSLATLVEMVAGGMGTTLLPAMATDVVRRAHPELALVPFAAGGPARTIGLAWRPTTARAHEYEALGAAMAAALDEGTQEQARRARAGDAG